MGNPLINPGRVDFQTLRLFCAVAQEGSISRGAVRCHLALSAASRRIADFESAAGTPLFVRSIQGVRLTSAGRAALQHALRLFHGFERMSAELADHSEGVLGQVRLWANMSALTEFLPAALSTFMDTHPGIRVEVEEQLSGDIVRAVLDGLADVGVFAEGVPTDGLITVPFRTDELAVLSPPGHGLSQRARVDFVECLDYSFVGLNRGSSILEVTSRAAADALRPLRLRVQVRSFDAMCQMISARLGIGVLPIAVANEAARSRGLHVTELSDAWARRQLLLAHSVERELTSSAKLMFEHLARPD